MLATPLNRARRSHAPIFIGFNVMRLFRSLYAIVASVAAVVIAFLLSFVLEMENKREQEKKETVRDFKSVHSFH